MLKKGDKFKVIKDHHEVHGDLSKGSIVVLLEINDRQMYYVKDLETSNTFTVSRDSVERMP
tara:strand:- start:329 stop:511 length:183 start_codon:yes stop_codon:yes gene_type:complete